MTNDRINGIIIGIFYIVAAVTSIIAVINYQPVLTKEWYMAVINESQTQILIGVLNDLLLVGTAIGTAVMFYPYLRHYNEHIALGYLCFRFMETVFIAIGLVSILGLLHLSISYAEGNFHNTENIQAAGLMLQSFHRWTFLLGPNLMLGINTFMYSYLLVRTGLVPKSLAKFGMFTAFSVFLAGILDMFGVLEPMSTLKGILALPVGIFEISLAIFLIVKGFRKEKIISFK